MCFFNIKTCQHILLHQMHNIMIFKIAPYDPLTPRNVLHVIYYIQKLLFIIVLMIFIANLSVSDDFVLFDSLNGKWCLFLNIFHTSLICRFGVNTAIMFIGSGRCTGPVTSSNYFLLKRAPSHRILLKCVGASITQVESKSVRDVKWCGQQSGQQ